MNPNGLVLAASITSQTSIPIRSHMSAISFTSPMFTDRNVFSRSLTVSATVAQETGWTFSSTPPYSAAAIFEHLGVTPPTTLGMFFVVYCALPGSTRSGENARKMSCPTLRPFCSNIGTRTSSVVPG
jgi:hypothetical protein